MTHRYETYADALAERYERLGAEDVHRDVLDELPHYPARVLDVGAGTGRDAAWLAGAGHEVVAVEPSDTRRRDVLAEDPDPGVEWLDDALPRLERVYQRNESFDVILLNAVWMHVPIEHRQEAMYRLQGLLKPGGKLVVSSRNATFSRENTLYRVRTEELVERGEAAGLMLSDRRESSSEAAESKFHWVSVVFEAPDDGTAALPTLRNIVVNDDKSSTYKLGLLRTLTRIAAASPGMANHAPDGYYDIPLGMVALEWARTYWPLITNDIRQQDQAGQTSKFRDELLEAADYLSAHDLRVGRQFTPVPARKAHALLREIRATIRDGPAKYITYPGTENEIFVYESSGFGRGHVSTVDNFDGPLSLEPPYLERFGRLRVPATIFEAMCRQWAWIEPTVLNEWIGLMERWHGSPRSVTDYYDEFYRFAEDERDQSRVRQLVLDLLASDTAPLRTVWKGRPIDNLGDVHIDHCIPYSVWYNNSLWNLLPSTSGANSDKADRLPARPLLDEAEPRIKRWWHHAFLDEATGENDDLRRQFIHQANASLPGVDLDPDHPDLDDLYTSLRSQVGRMKRDQQIEEWTG